MRVKAWSHAGGAVRQSLRESSVSTNKPLVLGSLLAGALSFVATAPVAMRVEVEPLRQVGDLTEVAVVIQVSPEDRVRIGSNAIVRIELDGGVVGSGSPMRAVRFEDDGSTRVVVEWPPGEHHLRVEIEDPNKEDTGLWVGTVRIPDLSPGTAVQKIDEVEPEPEPVPAPASAPASESPETVTAPEADSKEAIGTSVGTAAATTLVEPPIPEHTPEAAPKIEEIAPPIDPPEQDEVVPEPEREIHVAEDEPEPQVEAEEQPPLVEPLRADPPPLTAEPEVIVPRQQLESGPAMVSVSAELAARYEDWGSAGPDTREFSVVILRGREPATDIEAAGLHLRVGGSEVPVEGMGDLESAPLLLGLVIDVGPDEIDDWSGMQGSLAPIVERAGDGRGRMFVASPSGVGRWDAGSAPPDRVGGSRAPMNVSQLVIASLERFDGRRGRTFLVLLTDGRNEPSKEEWQQAAESAGAAGVPILVVALWDDDFNNRSRKNLKKLTEVSGGSLFLVQGRAQLESAADRFGRYLDGGYSIRFKSPGGDRQTVTTISVSVSDKELKVSAPKTIR